MRRAEQGAYKSKQHTDSEKRASAQNTREDNKENCGKRDGRDKNKRNERTVTL